jgi:hypothetical protein
MSVSKIELKLPFGFQPDPILETATPEQCEIILTTGCVALKALLFKTDSLSNEEAYKKATAEQAEKWLAEKSELEKKALREKQDLEDKNAAEVRQLNDKLIAEQNKIKLKEEEITRARASFESAEKRAQTLLKLQDKTIAEECTRTRAQVESEKTTMIEQLNKDLEKAKDAAEKASSDLRDAEKKAAEAAVQAEKAKNEAVKAEVQKVREELNKELEKERDLNRASAIRANKSVLIGKDNEDAFAELLDHSFGIGGHPYRRLDKTIKSGDHIIEWKGITLMFENKKYKNPVPTKEVDKAITDFESNKNCDVLVVVSENSNIVKRKRHFDITHIDDGRPAIWIGEFSHNQDKVVHLQLVGQVAEELVRLHKREEKLENGQEIVNHKKKVDYLIQLFKNTKVDIENLVKLQETCQLEHNATWNKLKREMVSMKARFNDSSLTDANGNTDDDSRGNNAKVDAGSKHSKAKKPRMTTPAKNTTAPSNHTGIPQFFVVSRGTEVASGYQPQQEASNALSAEVRINQEKLVFHQGKKN